MNRNYCTVCREAIKLKQVMTANAFDPNIAPTLPDRGHNEEE